MSSTEPPSRVPPRGHAHDTKAAREELSSKGKVEKVREVDADETRKRKFQRFYSDQPEETEETRPSPFDLASGKKQQMGTPSEGATRSGFSDAEDAIIPSPGYALPPNVSSSMDLGEEEDEDLATSGALPQSDDFWEDVDFPPEQQSPPTSFQEEPGLTKSTNFQEPQTRKGAAPKSSTEGQPDAKKGKGAQPHAASAQAAAKGKLEKKEQPSPFGLPGKPLKSEKEIAAAKAGKPGELLQPKEAEKKKLPSPFETAASPLHPKETEKKKPSSLFEKEAAGQPLKPGEKKKPTSAFETSHPALAIKPDEKKKQPTPFEQATAPFQPLTPMEQTAQQIPEEERILGHGARPSRAEKKESKEKSKEEGVLYQEPGEVPFKRDEREGGGGKRGREEKIVEIQSPSLPALPVNIQPIAAAAAAQATPYINPTTTALFFQMVGTMYVMTGTQGVSRTEIVLNNPAFADSKFFGSTIRIEKYATAPDSFNITLTGSDAAVKSFKENIPSLMTAFQNGNFTFKVSRLDVEYTIERPVFRRKEKGEEDRGDAGGGDLGERRK